MTRTTLTRNLGIGLIAAAAIALSACSGATPAPEPETPGPATTGSIPTIPSAELVAAATEEGKIVWYTNEPRDNAVAIADLFSATYPGIEVELFRLPGEKITAKLEAEFAGQGLEADIAYVTPTFAIERLAARGAFEPYYPEGFDEIDERYLDPAGMWVSTGYTQFVALAYNTDLVSEAEAPTSWHDLTDPKWNGKIAIGDPSSLTVATQVAVAWLENFGEDYLRDLGTNNPVLLSSFGDTEAAILSGSSSIGVVTDFRTYSDMAADRPIKVVVPKEGAVAGPGAMGITATAKHPNAAKLFANFLFSDAVMEIYAKNFMYPVRSEFTGEGMPALTDVPVLEFDGAVLTDEHRVAELRRTISSLID